MKVMIIGAGKLGYRLAELMDKEDIDVTVVDTNYKTLERINNHLDVLTVVGNGIEIASLKELDIETYDLLIATTDSDEANTLICSLAKKLSCKQTIARIRNPEFSEQFSFVKNEMGIDHIVNPDLTTAIEIKRYLMKSYNFHTGDFAKGKVSIFDFNIGNMSRFIRKRLMDLQSFDGFLITAISRDGNLIIPNGSTELEENDMLHIIGKSKEVNKLAENLKLSRDKRSSKKIMILGGGKIGYYLAQRLETRDVNVTLIEKDIDRCRYLAVKLHNTMIIHGDGTDIDILEEENLESMDAFVGTTDYDEQNLLMALVAKQSGVNKTIAKISRPNYIRIIDTLDIDVAFNPVDITASEILKFIRGGKVVSVSLLLGGEGEVTEIIAEEGSPIVGKPLYELNLPEGIIIGAVLHRGQVIIPDGNTIIHKNDRMVIFTLASDISILKKMLSPNKGGRFSELWNRNKGIR
ncbi:MAG: Trk system potassium transporter TrkA [Clostridium sp.]|nr:Trk system potassium transporter TrkA [Clostridium sp.]